MRKTWGLRSACCIVLLTVLQASAGRGAAPQDARNAAIARCEQDICTTGERACFQARCTPITFGCRSACGAIYSGACSTMCSAIGADTSACAAAFSAQAAACFKTCWNGDVPGDCGDRCEATAATTYTQCTGRATTGATPLPRATVSAAGRIATISSVKGTPSVTRRGVKIMLRQGGTINIGDTITTGAHEQVAFDGDNGERRVISANSELTIELRSANDGNQTVFERVWGTLEQVLSPSSMTPANSYVVTGGRLTMNGTEYRQFSHVRYEFNDVEERVTVFEGHVEATDPRTGERATIPKGTTFTLRAGGSLREGRITSASTPASPTPAPSSFNTGPPFTPSPAPSGSAARSSFTSGPEGWSGGSFPDNGPYDSVIGRAAVRWNQNGGPSGSAIYMADPGAGNFFFEAPPEYAGNKQAFYGGALRYDVKSENGEFFDEADVILIGGGLVLVYRAPGRPTSNWSSVTAPLTESAWKVDRLAGRTPTRDEFVRALGNVSTLRIRGEYRNGPDTGWLANVSLVPPSGSASPGPFQPAPQPPAVGPVRASDVTRRSAPAIARILISDEANSAGYVSLVEKASLARGAPKIYVTVQVSGATRGTVVFVSVAYLGNNATIGPLRGDITEDGDVMKAFSFTDTAREWPVGNFRVTVKLSDGTERTKDFRIE